MANRSAATAALLFCYYRSAVVVTLKWFLACGSKVFYIFMLRIFYPQGEKSAT